MKRRELLAGLVAMALVSPLESQFRNPDCVADKRCPSGAQPPACCAPPPCHFFQELAVLKNQVYLFDDRAARVALSLSGGDRHQALDELFRADLSEPRHEWCGEGRAIRPRLMKVDPSQGCAIVTADGQPLTREGAHRDSRSCPEYVDAEFDRMELRQRYCFADRGDRTFYDVVREQRNELQAQVNRLQSELQEYWRACSTQEFHPWLEREMAEAGVDMSTEYLRIAVEALR